MSEQVIKTGGIVYGTAYNADMVPEISRIHTIQGVDKLKGSKYVESNTLNAYTKIKADLENDMVVLVISTPCQIAGLLCFLGRKYKRLITSDLICHGVCPISYFEEEINFYKKNRTINDIRFLGNDKNNYKLSFWNDNKYLLREPAMANYYFRSFLTGISFREYCYSCNYSSIKQITDITIGNFIDLGKDIHFPYNMRNVSFVLVNTDSGWNFWNKIKSADVDLVCVERTLTEAIKYSPSLNTPFPKHHYTESFRLLYSKYGFVKAIRKLLWKEVFFYVSILSLIYRIPQKDFSCY